MRNWTTEEYARDPIIQAAVLATPPNKTPSLAYVLYLRTEWWQTRRRAALEADGFACTICDSRVHLQVHHTTYLSLFGEEAMDLTTLCDVCHRQETGRLFARHDNHAPKFVKIPDNVVRLIRYRNERGIVPPKR